MTLTSGTTLKSEWVVQNTVSTSDGHPAGGTCASTPGLGVNDATYDPGGAGEQTDAFDDALLFFVNGQQFVAPATWDVQTDGALNRVLTAGPTSVGGVNATVEYRAMPTQQVLRSTVFLANPGSSPVTVPFTLATNVGSDGSTVTITSSSGDATLTDADRWLVTSDSLTTPGDPVNTHVLAGPGTLVAPPTGTSGTVFACSGDQGVLSTYSVTIPAGATRGLMFFNELSPTNAAATTAAARFNQNPAWSNELLAGLSDAQRLNIVNWRLTQEQPDGVIRKLGTPYIGNNIYNTTARHQTVRTKAQRGDVRTFWVRIYNDGNATATFSAQGTSSAHKLWVRYLAGRTDVTAAMMSSQGVSFTLSPGQYKLFKVKMKAKGHAAIGARKFAKVTTTSLSSSLVAKDAVKAVLVVKR